jgi:hypothetical protein
MGFDCVARSGASPALAWGGGPYRELEVVPLAVEMEAVANEVTQFSNRS